MRGNLLLILIFFALNCNLATKLSLSSETCHFSFSSNKIWAHRVNSIDEVKKKHQLFEGLEIDLLFDPSKKDFYLAHDDTELIFEIRFEEWLNQIPKPEKNWYWLDLKNLNKKNADEIASLLEETPENMEFTGKLCNIPNVKVILVDYDTPIPYEY